MPASPMNESQQPARDPGWRRTGIIIAAMVVVWAGVVANRGRIQGHYFAHRLLATETAEEELDLPLD